MATTRVGISGWRYPPWRGVFYPDHLAQRDELAYASRQFRTIEINGSFYSLQRPESWKAWYESTERGFVFAVKGPRFITHTLRLRNVEAPLANFFASGVLALREKLGPILWQLPPTLRYDRRSLDAFLALLPKTTNDAIALSRKHDSHLKRPAHYGVEVPRRLHHAIEVRHESFEDPSFIGLLRKYNVAFVVADTAGKYPRYFDVTAGFVYVRLHGDKKLYTSGYSKKTLGEWARRIEAWRQGAELDEDPRISRAARRKRRSLNVYVYFDNDAKVKAPGDALALGSMIAAETSEIVGLKAPALSHQKSSHPSRKCRL
jgi:uncharacterized protein YecE (DUF72 family)